MKVETVKLSEPNESLILKAQAELEAAPFLFSESELPKIDRAKPKFHCTGERLFRDRPDIYKRVVRMLAEPGVSVRTICRECHVSDHTVRSVADRENIAIAAVKKAVLANITHGLRLASERVIEMMPEASAKDALLGVGILTDKMQLLSGEATIRVDDQRTLEAKAAACFAEGWEAFVRRLSSDPAGTHLASQNNLPKALHERSVVELDTTSAPAEVEEEQK